jgi:hypothetical protein
MGERPVPVTRIWGGVREVSSWALPAAVLLVISSVLFRLLR